MTIPPVETVPHGNLVYFEKMHRLYVDINGKIYDNKLEYISMGMSGDFADAIRAGSNMVRVGTAIFRCQGLYQIKKQEGLSMSLMDEFKKIIHPYDDEDDDYEEDVGRDSEPTYFEPREPREPP